MHPAPRSLRFAPEIGVFAVAVALRVGALVAQGGPGAGFGYDQSVYYAAADALIHGRLPYRDFHLLHPPLSMLLLTPFAGFGALTQDATGYFAANLAGLTAGALCAAVVVRITRRLGYPLAAALVAGLFCAVAPAATLAEHSARLEPFGNLALLLAVLAAAGPQPLSRRNGYWCGIALGAAVSVKIWYVAPVAVVLGWLLLRRSRRPAAAAAVLGAATVAAIVDLPFLLLAPSRMFHMVVTAQFGRPHNAVTPLSRLGGVDGVGLLGLSDRPLAAVASAAAVAATVAALFLARRARLGTLFALLALVQTLVIVASPSWFPYYDDYSVPALGLTLGAAWAGARSSRSPGLIARRACVVVPTAAALTVTLGWFALDRFRGSVDYPVARLRTALGHYRCLVADDPESQIYLDRLSADLADGCPDWVDVSGAGYWPDPYPYGSAARSRFWVQQQVRYFDSGGASLLVRTLPSPPMALRHALARNGVILQGREFEAYRAPAKVRPRLSGSVDEPTGSAIS